MHVIQYDLMELEYEASQNLAIVKWSDDLSVESLQFLQTIVFLFAIIKEKKIVNLLIDSGMPAGGVLTEDIIQHFIQYIPGTPLKRIAILESADYLWDNNLYQVISLLTTTFRLPIAIKMIKSRAAGLEWFSKS